MGSEGQCSLVSRCCSLPFSPSPTPLSSSPQPGGTPVCITQDTLGTLYVTDAARAAILSLKDDGGCQTVLHEYESRPFKGPHTAVFDSTGQLYFTDPGPYGETGLHNPKGSCYLVTGGAGQRILRPIASESLAYPSGLALNPSETAVYVAEQSANRLLRFLQKPAGVYHATVFHQFSGRMGPTAVVCDHSRGGLLYVARAEAADLSDRGIISVLSPEGLLLRDIEVPGPEISALSLSPDAKHLYFCDPHAVYRLLL